MSEPQLPRKPAVAARKIRIDPKLQGQVASPYVVNVAVTSPDSVALGGLKVQIVDTNVGPGTSLAGGTTDPTGRLTLQFEIDPRELAAHNKTRPDLQAQVMARKSIVLAASAIHYSASTHETLTVELPPQTAGLASEYDTLLAALRVHFGGPLAGLAENAERQDVTYLAVKSGWDPRAVAMASAAAELSDPGAQAGTAPVDPAFYYALFRAGVPADPDTLYRTSGSTLQTIWQQAIAQNVIPKTLAKQIAPAIGAFQSVSAARALTAMPAIGPSTLGDLLQVSLGADTTLHQQFADLHVQFANDPATLWSKVDETFGAATGARLRLDGQLTCLTLNNAPLIARLHGNARGKALGSALDLVTGGYYDASAWAPLLAGLDPPSVVPGDTRPEQRTNYAELLAAQVRLAFPTAVLGAVVRSGAVPLAPSNPKLKRVRANPMRATVAAFLTDNQADFNIGIEPIGTYLARTKAAPPPEVVDQVVRLQRVYQITPSLQALAGLLGRGLDSAYAIVNLGKEAFVQIVSDDVGGAEVATLIYRRAQMVHAAVLNIALTSLGGRAAPQLGSPRHQVIGA